MKTIFSLEDMRKAIEMARETREEFDLEGNSEGWIGYDEEEIIQSLSTQQLPKEFIPSVKCGRCYMPNGDKEGCWSARECSRNNGDYKDVFISTTNSEGKQELVGTYKY